MRHAFAVDPPGEAQPDEAQRVIVDRMLAEVVRRRMATPALLALEMSRPLGYMGAQAMHFFRPFLAAFVSTASYGQLAAFLERRGSIEYISRRLEELDGRAECVSPPDPAPPPEQS